MCGTETTVPGPDHAVQTEEPAAARRSPVQKEPRRSGEEDEDRPRRRSRERDEEEDRPPRRRRPRSPRETSSKATTALILGLLSFCLGPLTGIPAIIQGLKGLGEIDRSRGRLGGKGRAIAGMLLAGFSSFLFVIGVWLVYTRVDETKDRTIVMNRMKQMTLAMNNHQSIFHHLPTAAPIERVQPTKLSWRVQILPYVDAQNLARQFHQNEPWDSPHNKPLLTPMPKIFAHPKYPGANAQGLTYYRVFIGENAPFRPDRVTRLPQDFPDGTSNTILIVEAADPVPWTKPDELPYDRGKPVPEIGGHFRSGTVVGLADGSVRIISPDLSEQTLRCAIDPSDGLVLGPDW
ncbi:MAG TPA: DUF1559 domain-containing protein [Gemmataceae bacterium]|nr:DUF1559 domain-containing protein [Gemmataceae bacterium]